MKRIILFLIFISSCTNYDKGRIEFFERSPNKNTEFLNEYIWAFFDRTEAFRRGSKIHLYDSLFVLRKIDGIKEIINNNSYIEFNEAFISLAENQLNGVEINFSQLTKLKDFKVYAGCINGKTSYDNWNYYLSVPGVNKDSTKLVFYYEYYCGSECAIFSLVFMEKINGKWVYIKEKAEWIS